MPGIFAQGATHPPPRGPSHCSKGPTPMALAQSAQPGTVEQVIKSRTQVVLVGGLGTSPTAPLSTCTAYVCLTSLSKPLLDTHVCRLVLSFFKFLAAKVVVTGLTSSRGKQLADYGHTLVQYGFFCTCQHHSTFECPCSCPCWADCISQT